MGIISSFFGGQPKNKSDSEKPLSTDEESYTASIDAGEIRENVVNIMACTLGLAYKMLFYYINTPDHSSARWIEIAKEIDVEKTKKELILLHESSKEKKGAAVFETLLASAGDKKKALLKDTVLKELGPPGKSLAEISLERLIPLEECLSGATKRKGGKLITATNIAALRYAIEVIEGVPRPTSKTKHASRLNEREEWQKDESIREDCRRGNAYDDNNGFSNRHCYIEKWGKPLE